jgi:NO-binding membrane sensor protein with MHYT domain
MSATDSLIVREVRRVAEVHHFTYGVFNPLAACLLGFVGSFLGLLSAGRASRAHTRGRRSRWLAIAAFSIGGGAIWLMHFSAMFGFDVPASPVRYDPLLTMISLVLAVVTVGIGLMVVGHGRRSITKTVIAGVITGAGVLTMHYTGMRGVHVAGEIHYRPTLVVASGIIAAVAATAALWFAITARGWSRITGASAIMAAAVSGMHYTGMAAMQVKLSTAAPTGVSGVRPLVMLVPITLVAAATIIGVALSALQAMTEEEFTDGAGIPRRGAHAVNNEHHWSLKQASLAAMRRPAGPRPSPRPTRLRPADEVLQPVQGS